MKYLAWALAGIVAYLLVLHFLDDTDEKLAGVSAELKQRQLEYEALKADEAAKQEALSDSLQSYQRVLAERDEKERQAELEKSRLEAELSRVRATEKQLRERLEKDVSELPSMPDEALARRSLSLLEPFGLMGSPPPELSASIDGFKANRSYVEASSKAALAAVFWQEECTNAQHEVTICNTLLQTETEARNRERQVGEACGSSLSRCQDALRTAQALEANANARLAAEATRAQIYEKKWKLERWKGWGKTALAAGIGFLAGRAL